MDLIPLGEGLYVLDKTNERFYVLGIDPEHECLSAEMNGKFLAASCVDGRFVWLELSDCKMEFGEDDEIASANANEDCPKGA